MTRSRTQLRNTKIPQLRNTTLNARQDNRELHKAWLPIHIVVIHWRLRVYNNCSYIETSYAIILIPWPIIADDYNKLCITKVKVLMTRKLLLSNLKELLKISVCLRREIHGNYVTLHKDWYKKLDIVILT